MKLNGDKIDSIQFSGKESYIINLNEQHPTTPSGLSYQIKVGGRTYEKLDITTELFPTRLDGDTYYGYLTYSEDGIELSVVKNNPSRQGDHDGVKNAFVEDMDPADADLLALYFIGKLRKT